ncbi:uncharacterized protein Bfra_011526 [Botrytis fragariae]|uniref:BTB domain-containing protein n=1 Tax=Botrytis fragariae TaxID=1964551 RepID=A0A8H6AYC4_9HELO|nr:uncharacterized protein Bfra_011526 [Botrytis fragariae]KAF5875764.1 hypothetical protein Bfra_011526 [Botrytis fragariae]
MTKNDTSDVSCDDKELPSIEKSIGECNDGKDEFISSHESSLVERRSSPPRSQEHTSDMSECVSSSNEDDNGSVNSSDDADSTTEQDIEKWGTQMAQIEIGSHDKVLIVHANLLKEKFPFFANIFNSSRLNFYERYPELDPAGLKLVQLWIYGTSIAEQKRNKCRTTELFSLFAIAYHFDQRSLQDETMECIVKEIRESRDESRFTPEHVRFAYETTPGASKLRSFCAGSVAEAMQEDNQSNWDREQLSMLLMAIPELYIDISPDIFFRFENASTATNHTSYGYHQGTEVDDNIQPVDDKVEGDHTCGNCFPSSSSGSDENKCDSHAGMELDSSADSGSDSSGKTPDSMSIQYTSPDSKSGEESGNNKRVKLSDDADEVGAVTLKSPDPKAMTVRFYGDSSGPDHKRKLIRSIGLNTQL